MIPELVRTWASGWAISRHTPTPVAKPWGLYIEVGRPDQVGRHVLPDAHELTVREAATSVTVPHTWLKVPREPAEVAHWLPDGWVVDADETGHLMATDLRTTAPTAPEGHTVSMETRDGVTYIQLHDVEGELAAQGQMAVLGEATVIDRVITEQAHRRRGLGAFVMRTLADRAVADGATLGVLGATDEGRALYERLDWKAYAPLAACIYRPENSSRDLVETSRSSRSVIERG
ncbi:GNAT family N-acetyltransferase [Streptomyces platensis]|uniref:Acetyltransferase (GNAT) family protein n=1 Tax=Streptomyces platensis TaxID=58346 RepID=A0AAE6NR15_STRPT|nr:GNAT family N-acetyltransferase [Streptomyces platensis]OSY39960.1 Acetyltransferase (GNAT) family protein [Streptomyces platensis]QEV56405.1 GNAT family N-acetyltransferase [Streptomyces platensis]